MEQKLDLEILRSVGAESSLVAPNRTELTMSTVFNLASDKQMTYSLPAREAVIAAFAQSRGDWNTCEYEDKYAHLAKKGANTWNIGDFAAIERDFE